MEASVEDGVVAEASAAAGSAVGAEAGSAAAAVVEGAGSSNRLDAPQSAHQQAT